MSQHNAAEGLLAEIGAELAGQPGMNLEISIRLRDGGVEPRGRFACWLTSAFEPMALLLARLGAPEEARAAQREAERPVRQGIAVAVTGDAPPELRLYLHDRAKGTMANRYRALRWIPRKGEEVRRSRYSFHFLPETPAGLRPLDLVDPALRQAFARLLAEPRLAQMSGFWLREGEDGAIDQVDLALSWSPLAGSLRGLGELAPALVAPAAGALRELPIRHVALAVGAAPPSVTLYSSAPARGPWPASEAELHEQVRREAGAVRRATEDLFARLPPAPDAPAEPSALDGFYDGDIAAWQRVLGPELHYHAGLFERPDLDPSDEAMEAALRRAVVELYPFLPAGGRIYDVGCGWGGPMAMWTRDLGCPGLGITNSRTQFRHVASLGLPVRWGDAERTLPPGRFDCAVLLESLSHIRDKSRLLRVLRVLCGRLVMRVNCQDAAPPGAAFGGTMDMIASPTLRALIEASGWKIRHWCDRRREAMPSVEAWHRRLRSVPRGTDRHLETLRAWCARVLGGPGGGGAWARENPLIEVVAD